MLSLRYDLMVFAAFVVFATAIFVQVRLSGEALHGATGPLGKSVPKSSATTPKRTELIS